jgi:hypothetical protein
VELSGITTYADFPLPQLVMDDNDEPQYTIYDGATVSEIKCASICLLNFINVATVAVLPLAAAQGLMAISSRW